MDAGWRRLKSRLILSLSFVVVFLCLGNYAQATTISARTCSNSDVQAAVNAASNGDTVVVPAGSCSWTSSVAISGRGVTLQGAGVGQTNITVNATLSVNCSTTNFTRVTGFTFISGSGGSDLVEFDGPIAAVNSFRFDHNRVVETAANGQRGVTGIGAYGLIDHNTFDITTSSGSIQQIAFWGSNDGSDAGFTPWNLPTTLGSISAVYIEDNTFNNGSNVSEDIIDGYAGVRYVIRHNVFNGKGIGFHGTDSGNRRSLHSAEIYNNQFIKTGGSATYAVRFRGGTGVVFNNTATGTISDVELWNYRSCPRDSSYGDTSGWQTANGTKWKIGSTNFSADASRTCSTNGSVQFCSANRDLVCTNDATCSAAGAGTCSAYFDGPGTAGYPTRDQVGVGHGQVSTPIYLWNNTGLRAGAADGPGTCSPSNLVSNSIIVAGRDFVDNNTPAPGYTPFVYPHPLQSGTTSAKPDPPTGLTATVN